MVYPGRYREGGIPTLYPTLHNHGMAGSGRGLSFWLLYPTLPYGNIAGSGRGLFLAPYSVHCAGSVEASFWLLYPTLP